MSLKDQKNSKKQGDVGLGIAIGWFSAHGHTVCVPLTDSQNYDLVVDLGEGLKKVQVKTTWHKSRYGIYAVELRTKGGNRSGTGKTKVLDASVDLLFVATPECNYLIPVAEIVARTGLSLGRICDPYKLGSVTL